MQPRRVALGLTAFLALTVLGAATTGLLDGGRLPDAALRVPVSVLFPALVLLLVDFLLGGLRLHVWLRRLEPGVGYRVCFQTYLVNLFAAAVSPMGAASGPAQLAVMARRGVRAARAVAALLLMYVAILTSLLLLGGVSGAYLLSTTDLGARLGGFQRALLVGAALSATLLVLAILNPRGGDHVVAGLRSMGGALDGRAGRWLLRGAGRAEKAIAEYRAALETLKGGWRGPLAGCLATSMAMLANKCAIGFLVANGLGSDGSVLDIASRNALQYLFLYFSPSPGGSGIAEASVPAFMAGVLPEGSWMEFTILWRGVTSYVGVAIGALAVAFVFGQGRISRFRLESPPESSARSETAGGQAPAAASAPDSGRDMLDR